jgi:hypothetical protein
LKSIFGVKEEGAVAFFPVTPGRKASMGVGAELRADLARAQGASSGGLGLCRGDLDIKARGALGQDQRTGAGEIGGQR